LWSGVGLSLLVFLPNLVWQIQHNFISLDFLSSIHARDVQIGRAAGYLLEQFLFCANPVFIPLWITGLSYYFFKEDGKRFRLIGWMYVIPFLLYLISQGRSYYLAPAYPMLIAAGALLWERKLDTISADKVKSRLRSTWVEVAIGAVISGALALPIAPINSQWWKVVAEVHDTFTEQIGWHEMIKTVGDIYTGLPDEEKARAGILTGENDEAAALNIYGDQYGLPKAISGSDTFWLRGYGNPPPETLIIVGLERQYVDQLFDQCAVAGTTINSYGVDNDLAHPPEIYVCRKVRLPWPEIWEKVKHYS
jgi:hypothetical protein